MRILQQKLSVPFEYSVHFCRDVFAPRNILLRSVVEKGKETPAKMLVVLDRGVCTGRADLPARIEAYCKRHSDVVHLVRPPLLVPGGERVKNSTRYVHRVQAAIDKYGLCRHSYVMAVGGGAVVDMTGYAAATAHRGIRLVRVPTTVLSQNDSAVGVKNSINAYGKKNFLGTFVPAHAVLNDVSFLTTLSDRDWMAGTTEAVKVALLRDPSFFNYLERHVQDLVGRDLNVMEQLIYRCARLHMNHIGKCGDPFEMGTSRPLDFGHWAGHKLEQLTNFRLRHGEAVAIGLALDLTYSMHTGLLPEAQWERILRLLSGLGFRLYVPRKFEQFGERENPESLGHGLTEFREHLGGRLTIMLLGKIGSGIEVHEIDDGVMVKSIATLREAERRIRKNRRQAGRAK